MGKYFGTDGFRGEANKDLTVDHAFKIGRYLGWYYGQEHKAKVVIGKDTRRSSYMFENALCAGLTASGADACLLHVTSTPSVSYIARADDFDCGIMISASHNPYYDNGIKLLNGEGEKMDDETIADSLLHARWRIQPTAPLLYHDLDSSALDLRMPENIRQEAVYNDSLNLYFVGSILSGQSTGGNTNAKGAAAAVIGRM